MIIPKPLECKIHGLEQVGKWMPSKAFEGRLLDYIIYQIKEVFAQDLGVAFIMREQAEKYILKYEPIEYSSMVSSPWLASSEEMYYCGAFKEHPANLR